jgi:hypothetical protein
MTTMRRFMGRATAPRKRRNPAFSRRAFLGTAGAGAAIAPFVPLLHSEAAEGDFPKRLVLLFSANGTIHENWVPQGGETDFTLNTILQPLQDFRDKLVILDGLEVIRQGLGDGHQMGMACMWTGNQLLPGPFEGGDGGTAGYAGGISVDQHIANAIGGETLYKSLEFGVQTGGANNWTRMSYTGPDQPVAPEDSPQAMFDRLYADLGVDTTQIEKLKAERRSVIDLVKGDLESLTTRYGGGDRTKVEAHLDAIRAIEQRNEAAVPVCDEPVLDLAVDHQANDMFPTVSRLQIDMLVMAMACDLARVLSLQWSASVSGTVFNWLGIPEGHHDLSHLGDEDPTMVQKITDINVWYANEVAYLCQQMALVPEGDGTMLDNTLIVWGNELSRGNSHGNHPVPFVLIGGAAGALQTGRYLSYGQIAHNRMLVSLCHLMGLSDQQTFGDNDPASGGLPGLS